MRWCGCGPSTKLLIRSFVGGAENLAKYALTLDEVCGTHLNGIKRATTQVKLFATVAVYSAAPAEALLDSMFEDGRLLLMGPTYIERVEFEISNVRFIDERLGKIVDDGWRRLYRS